MSHHFPAWERIREIVRFYQAGVANMAFGITVYMLLVSFGFNIYAAQAISHLVGIVFNYQTYGGYVFRGTKPNKARFIFSYIGNYIISLITLTVVDCFVVSPYVSGFITTLIVSILNYFALKHFVYFQR